MILTTSQSIPDNIPRSIVYGAGDIGLRTVYALLNFRYGWGVNTHIDASYYPWHTEILCIADKNPALWGKKPYGIEIVSPERIKEFPYDEVFLAVANSSPFDYTIQHEVVGLLTQMGVKPSQIKLLPLLDEYLPRYDVMQKLYSGWLHKSDGCVAECGVFDGRFACRMNRLFDGRKLFLFDTFEGFTQKDIEYEKIIDNTELKNSSSNRAGAVRFNNIDAVINRMPYSENVIVKKGYVPDSLAGIDENFIFVNLDMDLYLPTFGALRFFWDKMISEGVIFIHDYYGLFGTSIQKSVSDFEHYLGHSVPKLPIGDGCTIALIKP